MKRNDTTKKEKETRKFNNGLKILIERSPGLKNCYIGEMNKYLREKYNGLHYDDTIISRVVNDHMPLTPKNIKMKEALVYVEREFNAVLNEPV